MKKLTIQIAALSILCGITSLVQSQTSCLDTNQKKEILKIYSELLMLRSYSDYSDNQILIMDSIINNLYLSVDIKEHNEDKLLTAIDILQKQILHQENIIDLTKKEARKKRFKTIVGYSIAVITGLMSGVLIALI